MAKIIGKVQRKDLERLVFKRTGVKNKDVVLGPAYGEDSAVIRVKTGDIVVSSDPIVFAADKIGKIGIHIVCNDIYASGAKPKFLLDIIFLPERDGKKVLNQITKQLNSESKKLGVTIVGGHSEYVPGLERPFLALTAFGIVKRDTSVSTRGAKTGDLLLLTKSAGLEVSGILATDLYKELVQKGISKQFLNKAKKHLDEISISKESVLVSSMAHSMHDPTEAGVLGGAQEMAICSGKDVELWEDKIPVAKETRAICQVVKINPLKCFSSGSLLFAIKAKDKERVLKLLRKNHIPVSVIGKVLGKSKNPCIYFHHKNGKTDKIEKAVRDEFYRIWDKYKT